MINYQDEIKHFKPSLDVDNIEDVIAGMNLTDMNDLMMQLVQNAANSAANTTATERMYRNDAEDRTGFGNTANEG
ncbi:MAG: hypothetical protein Q4E57_04145 [Eubacteriales bacterium]|nr:hypothetical protein [Eubacteriales bacterium]